MNKALLPAKHRAAIFVLLSVFTLCSKPSWCATEFSSASDAIEDHSLRRRTEDTLGHSSIFEKHYEIKEMKQTNWTKAFVVPFAEIKFGKTETELAQCRDQLMQTCLKTYNDPNPAILSAIPLKHHRIWLTNPLSPMEPPKDRIDYFLKSIRKQAEGWEYNLWSSVGMDALPETKRLIDAFNAENPTRQIHYRTINEITMQAQHVIDALLADHRYTNANDIVRMNIINVEGGLYADIGMEFNIDLTPFMQHYEYMWWMHGWKLNSGAGWYRDSNIDHAVMAAAPQTFITKELLSFIGSLYLDDSKNRQIREICKGNALNPSMKVSPSLSQLTLTGSHYFMAIIDSLSTGNEKMLFINSGLLVTGHHLGSWGIHPGRNTFGNKGVNESTLDIFDIKPHTLPVSVPLYVHEIALFEAEGDRQVTLLFEQLRLTGEADESSELSNAYAIGGRQSTSFSAPYAIGGRQSTSFSDPYAIGGRESTSFPAPYAAGGHQSTSFPDPYTMGGRQSMSLSSPYAMGGRDSANIDDINIGL